MCPETVEGEVVNVFDVMLRVKVEVMNVLDIMLEMAA
jgi:hypothetical protein